MLTRYLTTSRVGQNAHYKELLELAGERCEIDIRTDTYQKSLGQGHARIRIWVASARRWNDLFAIPPQEMRSEPDLAYRYGQPQASDFAVDRATLIRQANFILGTDDFAPSPL